MITLFLKTYWKQIIIAIIIIAIGLYWNSLLKDRTELIQTNVKLDQMQSTLSSYQKSLDDLRQIGIDQQKRLDQSITLSNNIGKKFDTQINTIAAQRPPKECNDAIRWFINTKDDLAWPQK
jgi:hypothetical protein